MSNPEAKAEFITHLLDGNNATARGELDSAIASYNKALALNPGFALIYSKIGQAYFKKKDYDEAIDYFKRALEFDPEHTETLYRLGKVYGEKGMPIQAAVAFDLVKERDKEGNFAERIDESMHKIRRRSSGGSVHHVSKIGVFRDSALLLAAHPALLIPGAVSAAAILLMNLFFRIAFESLTGKTPSVSLIDIVFRPQADSVSAAIVYYIFLAVVLAFVTAPLFSSVMILTRELSRKRDAVFYDALARSFGSISSLSGITLAILAGVVATAVVSGYVLESASLMIGELLQRKILLRPLAVPVCLMPAAYFIYIYPAIAIDRRSMEKGLKKAVLFSSKFFWWTFLLILCYSAIHVTTVLYITGEGTAFPILAQAALIISQTLLAMCITLTYTKSQQQKRKHRRKESDPEDAEQPAEPQYIGSAEPDEDF